MLRTIINKGLNEADNSHTHQINDERYMFPACISSNKRKKTLTILEGLNEFHNNIYIDHYDKPPAELLKPMASLKCCSHYLPAIFR